MIYDSTFIIDTGVRSIYRSSEMLTYFYLMSFTFCLLLYTFTLCLLLYLCIGYFNSALYLFTPKHIILHHNISHHGKKVRKWERYEWENDGSYGIDHITFIEKEERMRKTWMGEWWILRDRPHYLHRKRRESEKEKEGERWILRDRPRYLLHA